MTQLIKIIYSLNDIDSSISFDPSNKISVFKNLINLTQKINLDEYDLFYGKKLISWNEDKMIKEFIGKELVPLFQIKKKVAPHNNQRIKLTEYRKDIDIDADYKTKLVIDYFPSRVEICTLLDKFYEDNNLSKDYHVDHSGSSVIISFKKPDIAFEFTKKINTEKLNNPLYFKIKTKLDFDVKKKHSHFLSKSPSKKMKIDEIFELDKIISSAQIKKNKTIDGVSDEKKVSKIFLPKHSLNNIKINRLISHLNDIKDEKIKGKIVKLYYQQASSLRTSEPYTNEKTYKYKEYVDNKKRWVNEKGMIPSYKYSDQFIPSDVNYNLPYGKPISEYVFRDLHNKKKSMESNESNIY